MNKFTPAKCAIFFSLLAISTCQLRRKAMFGQNEIVDTETLLKKWTLAEIRMNELLQNAIKMLLPMGIEASQSLNISGTCVRDVFKIVSGLKKMKLWAFKFVDASSKSIDGVASLTIASLGNYDECINNEVIDERSQKSNKDVLFRGKYCRVEVRPYLSPRPKKMYIPQTLGVFKNFTKKDTIISYFARKAHLFYRGTLTLGICVPSGCSKDDVNQVLKKASDYFALMIKSPRCEIKEDTKLTPLMIAVITVYSCTVLLVVIGSVFDVYAIYRGKNFKSTGFRILMCFSFISNFRKLTDTTKSSETFGCLNSIRTISMTWIIHGHSLLAFVYAIHNMAKMFDVVEDLAFQCIMSAPIAVDTFFFITGTLVCYNVTKMVKIGKKSFNVAMYVLHRIWRIYPSYVYVILFVFLIPLLASGPEFHSMVDSEIEYCRKNWWASLLFINNFYDVENMCYLTGWYLTLDLQLHIGALIILLPLMWKPRVGITIAVITIIISMIGSWLSIYLNDLMPKNGFTVDSELAFNTFEYFYILPHAHAGPYCIGILCGYLLAVKPGLKIPKVIQVLGWSIATVTSVVLIYGVPKWNGFVEPSFIETLFFSSCYRVTWAVCVAWVVVCCCTGHGGLVNHILTWKMWIPLGRLTFVAYLVHPIIILLHAASVRSEVVIDFRTDVWRYLGHVVVTYLCALGGSLLIESPFLSLEKILLSKEKRNQQPSKDCPNTVETDQPSKYSVSNFVPEEHIVKETDTEKDAGFWSINFACKM